MRLTEMQIEAIRLRAGTHSDRDVPEDPLLRTCFGMMECLDWSCCKYGDAPDGVTEEGIQEWMIAHREDVLRLPEPTSYLGLFSNLFEFLSDGR